MKFGARVHPSAYVDDGARLGVSCIFGQNVTVGPRVVLGNNVKVQNNVSIYEGVEIEDDVFCGPSMVFTNVINPRSAIERKTEFRRTLVKRGASMGANCTIVCGVTIGRCAFVGAGAVATRMWRITRWSRARRRGGARGCASAVRSCGWAGAETEGVENW